MIGILLLIVTNYLAGYPLFRVFFRESNLLEKVILPQALSLIVTPFLFVLIYLAVGFDSALSLFPLLVLAIFLASVRLTQRTRKIKIRRKDFAMLAVLILVLLILLALPIINMSQYLNYADPLAHTSIANEIKNNKILPPANPGLYGTTLNYQWFYHLTIALLSSYSGIEVLWILPYFTIYLAALLAITAFILAYNYFKKVSTTLAFVAILTLFFSEFYFIPQTQGYALVLIALFFFIFLKYQNEKANRFAILAGIVAASLVYIHALSFIFVALFLTGYCFYLFIFKPKKESVKVAAMLLLPFIIGVPYYISLKGFTGSAFLFEPLSGLIYNYPRVFQMLLILLPFGIVELLKKKDERSGVFLLLLGILFLFVNTFTMLRGRNIDRFVSFMVFPILIIVLSFLDGKKELIKYGMISLCIILIFLPVVVPITNPILYYVAQSAKENPVVNSDEYIVGSWIKSNVKPNETVLAAPLTIYSAIGERKVMICEPGLQYSQFYNVSETMIDMGIMFSHPSRDIAEKYKISYVVLGDREREILDQYGVGMFDFAGSGSFRAVFSYRNYTIFKLIDTNSLPPSTTNRSEIKESMMSAYPARWWIG